MEHHQQYLDQFHTLLQRSTALLHRIEGVDWKDIIVHAGAASSSPSSTLTSSRGNDDKVNDLQQGEEDDDSSDDDDMMMFGGYSDSEDEAIDNEAVEELAEDDDDEDEEALLKRASSVHAALLLSLPTTASAGQDDGKSGKELVDQLISTILTNGQQQVTNNDDSSSESCASLASVLSFVISSSSIDKHQPKTIGQERWKRICLTNSLLAIQFLLHLMQQSDDASTNNSDGSPLDEWNVVILPLLLGKPVETTSNASKSEPSLFLLNDALRDALLNLTSFTSSKYSNSNTMGQGCKTTVSLCLSALHHATSSKEMALRQKKIMVVCQVLIRLHEVSITNNKKSKNAKEKEEELEIVRGAMHQSVLMILRGICYEVAVVSNDGQMMDVDGQVNTRVPLLSLESLRPVTGMLLPKLYPQTATAGVDDRAIELWNEVLLLLSPYSESFVDGDVQGGAKRRCCKNWNHVAPMAATAILCILLPTFRKMELPIKPNDTEHFCRPVYKPSLWRLIQTCLGKCGDSEIGDSGGRGTSLLSRGARDGELSSNDNDDGLLLDNLGDYDHASMDQLLRRRSAHALRLMVEYEREQLLRGGGKNNGKKKKKGQQQNNASSSSEDESRQRRHDVDMWMKYVLCFEMLEMEMELHLVEQVWATVKEIASEVASNEGQNDSMIDGTTVVHQLPRLAWDDIGSLFCRVLLSDTPTMRKLGLFRFLSGHAGVDVTVPKATAVTKNDATTEDTSAFMKQPKSKSKIKNKSGGTALVTSAPLSIVSVSFVLDVVMRAYDSIVGAKVGQNMQIEQESISIADLLSSFLSNYTLTLAASLDGEEGSAPRLSEFVNRVFGPELIQSHKSRSLVIFYRSVATALDTSESTGEKKLDIEPENVQATIRSMRAIFSSGGAPKSMQEGLRLDLAIVLKNAKPWEKVDASLVLQVLALYPPPEELMDEAEESPQSKARDALGKWLLGLGGGKWSQNASSACASAFVMGQLMPFGEIDVMSGVNSAEREIGMSICILCALAGNGNELLWPAVFKGLQSAPPIIASSTPVFCKANRSMILLEFGCKEGVLSGMGNGDLIFDKSKEYMMPPPPRIESLLGNAVQFILSQLMSMSTTLFEPNGGSNTSCGSTRSSTTNSASSYVAILIGQVRILHLAYPSSVSLSQAVDSMLEDCVNSLTAIDREAQINSNSASESSIHVVKFLTLAYAALSCGANFTGGEKLNRLISTCHTILGLELSIPPGIKKEAKQACRSIFQYAKWGSLSLIVPKIMEESESQGNEEVEDVYQAILESARDSVDATPVIALPPLFECALGAGKHISRQKNPLLSSLKTIIETLFAVLEEETSSTNWSYMLNQVCKLLFRGKLLLDEYQLSYSNENCGPMPIMQAFEKLLKIGGTTKPHIFKVVVSQMSVAWLGPDEQPTCDVGVCAIPYREHIVDLLVYKECRFDESSAHLDEGRKWDALPEATDSSSITRAFVLAFFSKLPPPGDMSDVVLTELVHFVIIKLMDICCAKPARGKAFISGSEEYSRMSRAWQSLCLLSRFVTEDIAKDVAVRVFPAMAFTLHGQIRYWIEVFTIQCTRRHPTIFGQMFIEEVRRNDISTQHVSSLMVIGGNLTVGRYHNDFFCSSADPRIKDVLCGVLPWLSSTQGFSRAIAQLLCHKLIPLVVNVNTKASSDGKEKDDAVLRSLYSFLDGNSVMSGLRIKQQHFFDTYDVDSACSFEGLLSIPVDEGEEANPLHMVDAIKECLAEVYKQTHDEDAPAWKRMEDLLLDSDQANESGAHDVQNETELVNFQRKILPIDALDLGIRSFKEQKQFNAAGKKKQSLIVCASLIDKVPNLAGLARTCEIFSAQTLVMPNLLVRKQDDFKSISASANDWIEMEECKEEDLLSWLYTKKSEGYDIVGLEQTASSKCLTKMGFPEKTVLLLGKEKEGIPIEFLSAVDQCIEIPQLGIIRSLNVHVSGAISIWEYTKQMMQKK